MADFLEFLSSNELTIVVVLMIAIFVLIMTIIIIDIVSRRKNKDNNEFDEERALEDTNIKINASNNGLGMIADENALRDINIEKVGRNLDKTAEIEEIKYVEEDEELEKTKALLELETLKKELAKMEQEKNQMPVQEEVSIKERENEKVEEISKEENKESIIDVKPQEQEVIEPVKTMEDEVNTFEQEQEENAIISVEELAKASRTITDEEIEQYEDDGNEPISIKELEALYKSVDEPVKEDKPKEVTHKEKMTMPDFKVKVKPAVDVYDDKEFKNTPVISPVYGLKPTESSISLEQTANLDKLNEEIRKTNEFLSALKELRKNLE